MSIAAIVLGATLLAPPLRSFDPATRVISLRVRATRDTASLVMSTDTGQLAWYNTDFFCRSYKRAINCSIEVMYVQPDQCAYPVRYSVQACNSQGKCSPVEEEALIQCDGTIVGDCPCEVLGVAYP